MPRRLPRRERRRRDAGRIRSRRRGRLCGRWRRWADDRGRLPVVHRLGPRHLHCHARPAAGDRPARRRRRRFCSHVVRTGQRAACCPTGSANAATPPEYNSVDASLWFVVAVDDFLRAGCRCGLAVPQGEAQAGCRPSQAILEGYARGHALRRSPSTPTAWCAPASPALQLTWMDAKIGDCGGDAARSASRSRSRRCGSTRCALPVAGRPHWAQTERAARDGLPSRDFPNPANGGLFDVVDVDHVPGRNDAHDPPQPDLRRRRPAASGLEGDRGARASSIWSKRRLLTPLGLRSLAPDDAGLRRRTIAAVRRERDARLPSRHRLALADRAVRRGLAACARANAGGERRRRGALHAAPASTSRNRGPRPRLGSGRRRPAAHAGRLPVPGLVARRADPASAGCSTATNLRIRE